MNNRTLKEALKSLWFKKKKRTSFVRYQLDETTDKSTQRMAFFFFFRSRSASSICELGRSEKKKS